MEKITYCLPSKSNLEYLKTCIPSLRENSHRDDHDIYILVDQDHDGTVEWLEEHAEEYGVRYFVNPNLNEELYGIGEAYDFLIEQSDTDICMIFHADMILGKDADLHMFEHLEEKTIVSATRIEPPIHPNAGEKILKPFGMWPEEFDHDQFDQFVEDNLDSDKVTEGAFAPWMIYKEDFLGSIDGHDPILKSAREDSDVFNRLLLAGFKFVQPWNALVYHFTGRGGQFQHGKVTQDHNQKSEEWKKLMANSTKEFIRKWQGTVNHTPMMKPIVNPRYDMSFKIHNANEQVIEAMELWCDKLYVDTEDRKRYIKREQPNTSFDLSKRIRSFDDPVEGDVVVEFDASRLSGDGYKLLQQLNLIIEDSGEVGEFGLDIFNIKINKIEDKKTELVKLDSEWYNDKLLEVEDGND